jgi:hypothetical protein
VSLRLDFVLPLSDWILGSVSVRLDSWFWVFPFVFVVLCLSVWTHCLLSFRLDSLSSVFSFQGCREGGFSNRDKNLTPNIKTRSHLSPSTLTSRFYPHLSISLSLLRWIRRYGTYNTGGAFDDLPFDIADLTKRLDTLGTALRALTTSIASLKKNDLVETQNTISGHKDMLAKLTLQVKEENEAMTYKIKKLMEVRRKSYQSKQWQIGKVASVLMAGGHSSKFSKIFAATISNFTDEQCSILPQDADVVINPEQDTFDPAKIAFWTSGDFLAALMNQIKGLHGTLDSKKQGFKDLGVAGALRPNIANCMVRPKGTGDLSSQQGGLGRHILMNSESQVN